MQALFEQGKVSWKTKQVSREAERGKPKMKDLLETYSKMPSSNKDSNDFSFL
jgi:hypothetical protein